MAITKADWDFIFDDSVSDLDYDEQFRDLASRYYIHSKAERAHDHLSTRELILNAEKDKWTEIALYNRKYWVTNIRRVNNNDEENERFRIFYFMLDRCGMIKAYSDFFCNGEQPLREFSDIYKKLVRIQDQLQDEEARKPFWKWMAVGILAGIVIFIAVLIMHLAPENRESALLNVLVSAFMLIVFHVAGWLKETKKARSKSKPYLR